MSRKRVRGKKIQARRVRRSRVRCSLGLTPLDHAASMLDMGKDTNCEGPQRQAHSSILDVYERIETMSSNNSISCLPSAVCTGRESMTRHKSSTVRTPDFLDGQLQNSQHIA